MIPWPFLFCQKPIVSAPESTLSGLVIPTWALPPDVMLAGLPVMTAEPPPTRIRQARQTSTSPCSTVQDTPMGYR